VREGSPFVIRRIVVALDASPCSLAALHAAADLAAHMEAELVGVFVEESSLLRVADVPCAREIFFPSAAEAPVTRSGMESSLRAQSQRIRESLAAVARDTHVSWRFRTARGRVAEEVLAAAEDADLVAVGRVGWSVGARARLGSTAQELMTSAIPILLLPGRPVPQPFHFVVFFDATPAARRALLAAAHLVQAYKRNLTILIAAAGQNEEQVRREAEEVLQGRVEARYRLVDPQNQAHLRQALESEQGGVLVLGGGRKAFRKLEMLESVLSETEIPVLLLDGR
jgi:nucleotide-binding universal stress UspA family protein